MQKKQASPSVLLGFADRQIYNKISLEQLAANVKLAVEIYANLPGGLARAQLSPPLSETPDA